MASRRPPLFELLQHDESPRPGRGSGNGHSGSLGQAPSKPSNGQAEGAVETKPNSPASTNPAKPSTLEGLSKAKVEPKAKPEPQPSAKPQTVHVPAPRPTPVAAQPEAKPERPAGAADWSGMHPKNAVRVRMIWVYAAIVAAMTLVLGVWVLGYKLGVDNEKAKLEPYLNRSGQPGPIADPMAAQTDQEESASPPPLSGIDRREEPRQAEQTPRIDPRPPVIEPKPGPVQTIDVLVDVREAGNNYMKLASGMTRERAVGLAQQLSTNGVHAMAIDEGRQGFGLYTAFAVPSGQYSAMEGERRDLTARVIRLLRSTPQELGGPYTPRDPLWMRFDG